MEKRIPTTTRVLLLLLLLLLLGLLPLPVAALTMPPGVLSAAVGIAVSLVETTQPPEPLQQQSIPVLEVIKVYGKLAGSDCYGKQAPRGSSCQIDLSDLSQKLSIAGGDDPFLPRDDFATKLNQLDFAWPLKPFGIDQSPSLAKTAIMNKGAETYVYLQELEARGLYDPRNPTGPLPASLRPALNRQLQDEGILESGVVDRAYEVLVGGTETQPGILRGASAGGGSGFLDYYEFLKLFGPNSVSWPKY
jgi:hypothetical protein